MNNMSNITCPKCGAEIPLTEAVSHRVREELAADFEKQRKEQSEALAKREAALTKTKEDLEAKAASIQSQIDTRLDAERKKLLAQAGQKAEEKLGEDLKNVREELARQNEKLRKAREAELKLLKEQGELQEARENLKLELARQLQAERDAIAQKAREQALEGEKLKLADKEQMIQGLQKQIGELQQRANQGSMQAQGESLEITLEADLRAVFPYDDISEIKKGERGADVMQKVRTNVGLECGSILWEAKRAKNWSGGWVDKLKEDQREAKAELAVLVTTCPPQGLRGIGQVEGVWVCELPFAPTLAVALRNGMVSTAVRLTQEAGRGDKMSQLYDYLCGIEFRQHIEGMVESFKALQSQLATEQRAFARQWKEREQQLTKALQHTAMMYGSIQGIAGRAALPEVEVLRLPGMATETEFTPAVTGK
jgi:hypothetical protein